MRRTYHRQECIDRERDDCRTVADAKERNEKAEHRNRRNRIEEVHCPERGCRCPFIFVNKNARRPAENDGNADRRT